MTNRMESWWQGRSERERRLILVMLTLLLMVFAWLLVLRPLDHRLEEARSDHDEAVTALAEARARAAFASASAPAPRAAPPLPVDSFLSRTASEAGFVEAQIEALGPARARIRIPAARPPAAFAWIGRMEAQGLRVERLRAQASADRTIRLEAIFAAEGR